MLVANFSPLWLVHKSYSCSLVCAYVRYHFLALCIKKCGLELGVAVLDSEILRS